MIKRLVLQTMELNEDWDDQEFDGENDKSITEELCRALSPFLKHNGLVDLTITSFSENDAKILARFLNEKILLAEEACSPYFGSESVTALQIKVEDQMTIKLWGRIYWFSTPSDHESYRDSYDPFYGEFQLSENTVQVSKIKFGDLNHTNIEKHSWFNRKIKWIYNL